MISLCSIVCCSIVCHIILRWKYNNDNNNNNNNLNNNNNGVNDYDTTTDNNNNNNSCNNNDNNNTLKAEAPQPPDLGVLPEQVGALQAAGAPLHKKEEEKETKVL